jgi:UDP-N-acetylmuramate dehydrogenase
VQLLEDVPLAARSTLGVGGPARFFVEARDDASVVEALEWAERTRVGVRVLGGGSNVVVSDAGFSGLVLHVALRGVEHVERGGAVEVTARAGEPWDALVGLAVERGWSGLECLSGIPGLVGATPIQNVGAYGQDVSETITRVRVLDRRTRSVRELTNAECRFAYRDSFFKSEEPERFVVLDVTYRLAAGGAPSVRYAELERKLAGMTAPALDDARRAVIELRRAKSMVLDSKDENARSCGSFFVNPIVGADEFRDVEARAAERVPHWEQSDGRVKLPAAWLIEHAGFHKGERLGAAGLSSRHALAIVARAGARAGDVVALARQIRARVDDRFGVRLAPEPVFWGFLSLDGGLPDERVA